MPQGNAYDIVRSLTIEAIEEFSRQEYRDLAITNVKCRHTVSAVHHFITVASAAGRIAETVCSKGCGPFDGKDMAYIAFILGLVHDYTKMMTSRETEEKFLELVRKIAQSQIEKVTAVARRIIEEIASDPKRYSSCAESGVSPWGRVKIPEEACRAVIIADLLSSMESIDEVLENYGHVIVYGEPVNEKDTYEKSLSWLRENSVTLSYVKVNPYVPHRILIGKLSDRIIELVGAVPLISYPDGVIVIVAGREPRKIPGDYIAGIISDLIVEKPGPDYVKTIVQEYYEGKGRGRARGTGIAFAKLILATILMEEGASPEEVYERIYADTGQEKRDKILAALSDLATCIKSLAGKCRVKVASLTGFNPNHGDRYLEAHHRIFLLDTRLAEILGETVERVSESVIDTYAEEYNVPEERLSSALLLLTYSKDPRNLERIAEELGIEPPAGPSITERLLWAVRSSKHLEPDEVAEAIAENPPVGIVAPRTLACKVAASITSPLVEPVECPERGDTVTCSLCQLSAPPEEMLPITKVKGALRESSFDTFESWMNLFPTYDRVDYYLNPQRGKSTPYMVCSLCLWEAQKGLYPPRLRIVLGPPIGVELLGLLLSRLGDKLREDAIVDFFSGSLIIRLGKRNGRYPGELVVKDFVGREETIMTRGADGAFAEAMTSKLSFARIFPLYIASDIIRLFLGGRPLLELSNNGTGIPLRLEEVEDLFGYRYCGEEYGRINRYKLHVYSSISSALRSWARAVGVVKNGKPFPSGRNLEKSGTLHSVIEGLEVVRRGLDGARFVAPFSVASLGARYTSPGLRDPAVQGRVMALLGRALREAFLLDEISRELEVIGVLRSKLLSSLWRYSSNVANLFKRVKGGGDALLRVSSHEVASFLKGLEDAVRVYAKKCSPGPGEKVDCGDAIEEGVELAGAFATNRLVKVYGCNPAVNETCNNVVESVRSVAREVLEDLASGRYSLSEVKRRIKDIYHLSYHFYIFYLRRELKKRKEVETSG